MAQADFELLITLIESKIYHEQNSYSSSRETGSINIALFGYSLQYIVKISKQVIHMIVLKVCQVVVEALKRNHIDKKLYNSKINT